MAVLSRRAATKSAAILYRTDTIRNRVSRPKCAKRAAVAGACSLHAAIFADPSARGIALSGDARCKSASTIPGMALVGVAAVTAPGQGREIPRPASSLRETSTEAMAR